MARSAAAKRLDRLDDRRQRVGFGRRLRRGLRRTIGIAAAERLIQVDGGDQPVAFKRALREDGLEKINTLGDDFAAILHAVAQPRLREVILHARRAQEPALRLIFGARALEIGDGVGDLLRRLQQRLIIGVDRLIIIGALELQISAEAAALKNRQAQVRA